MIDYRRCHDMRLAMGEFVSANKKDVLNNRMYRVHL